MPLLFTYHLMSYNQTNVIKIVDRSLTDLSLLLVRGFLLISICACPFWRVGVYFFCENLIHWLSFMTSRRKGMRLMWSNRKISESGYGGVLFGCTILSSEMWCPEILNEKEKSGVSLCIWLPVTNRLPKKKIPLQRLGCIPIELQPDNIEYLVSSTVGDETIVYLLTRLIAC